MDKQTTIAFVLIGAILIIWLYFNSPEPQPAIKKMADSTLVRTNNQTSKPNTGNVPAQNNISSDSSSIGSAFSSSQEKEQVITIENNLVKLEMTSKGAKIRRWFLKKYQTWYAYLPKNKDNFYTQHIDLINSDEGDLNLAFVTKDGKLLNTADASFNSNLDKNYYKLNNADSLVLKYSVGVYENSSITKNFVFKGNDYAVRCDVQMNNMEKIISNDNYNLVWANGINFVEKNSVDEATYSNSSAYSGDEQVIVNVKVNEPAKKEINGKVDWIGIRNKYFAVIIAPQNPGNEGGAYIEGTEKHAGNDLGVRKYYSAGLKVPFNNTSIQTNSFLIYIGPVDYSVLKAYGKNFEKIVDFGSLFGLKIIIRPISEYVLLPLFGFLHLFISNYGIVIIVFSLIIKFALYPFTKSSFKSMKKMQQLQPKITELKEKFKDDPQKVNKETMKLYSTYGINPAGGCLPMLLQMPILVALWGLFNVAIELRQQPFTLWITNLSSPDVIFTLPFAIPIFGIQQVSGLALLLGITMYFQQKMSVKDPSQAALVYIMPVMFTLMFMGFPSGLNLYYFMFNLFSIIQQYYVNNSKNDMELVPVANPKKSGGFMHRMMEAAEKNAHTQKLDQQKNNKRK
ncbi:MAG: membrane protein insertase YidC [Ignavibacteria bacterium]